MKYLIALIAVLVIVSPATSLAAQKSKLKKRRSSENLLRIMKLNISVQNQTWKLAEA